jgi:hypothetical protein
MTGIIQFKPNEPQVLSLKETSGVIDGFYVLYESSDGRTLQLPRPAAIKLNTLDPEPGEEFTATRQQDGPKAPQEWVFALTAQSEQLRAEREAAELAEQTRRDLPAQLQASVLRQMPKPARRLAPEAPQESKATGTYGPLPQVALAGRKKLPPRVSYRTALRQITETVLELLETRKEQWESDPRQGLISTLFIAACKAGVIDFDFTPEAGEGIQ